MSEKKSQINSINPLSFEEIKSKINSLTHKSVKDLMNNLNINEINKNNKGVIGQLVENHIGLKTNNISSPDLGNVEIKTIPIKFNSKNEPVSKERMVISKVDFNEIKTKTFFENHNINKINNTLFVCYQYDKNQKIEEYRFLGGFIFRLDDLDDELTNVLVKDYQKLSDICKRDDYDQISSSITTYLEMATKSAKGSDKTNFNGFNIKPRAFAFKSILMNEIISNYYDSETKKFMLYKTDEIVNLFNNLDIVLNNVNNTTINEDFILKTRINKSDVAIKQIEWLKIALSKCNNDNSNFDLSNVTNNQFKNWLLTRKYIVKNISVNEKFKIKESMSFPNFSFIDIVTNDSKEDTTIYKKLKEYKFIFIITQNLKTKYKLLKIITHKFDDKDIEKYVLPIIENTKEILNNKLILTYKKNSNGGTFSNNFISSKQNPMCHVRPHGSNRCDMYKLPYCTQIEFINTNDENNIFKKDLDYKKQIINTHSYTKQCFWINNTYLEKIIFSNKK